MVVRLVGCLAHSHSCIFDHVTISLMCTLQTISLRCTLQLKICTMLFACTFFLYMVDIVYHHIRKIIKRLTCNCMIRIMFMLHGMHNQWKMGRVSQSTPVKCCVLYWCICLLADWCVCVNRLVRLLT